jgi:hypothetical protein
MVDKEINIQKEKIHEKDYIENDDEEQEVDTENSEEDEENEYEKKRREREEIREGETYKKFEYHWEKFKNKCEENNILVRSEFACCDVCGNHEIHDEYKHTEENKYYAYIFYHDQEADRIYDMCKKEKKMIIVHLGWNYLKNNNYDLGCAKLAEKIHEYSLSVSCDLEYTDINRKLLLKIKIN